MKNKNAIICIAILMVGIACLCIFASIVLTIPPTSNGGEALSTDDVVAISSGDETGQEQSDDTDFSDSNIDSEVSDESSTEQAQQLILPPGTTVNSQIAIVYDISLDAAIYSLNENVVTAPASLTKLITALVALEYLPTTKTLTVGEEINRVGENSSIAFLSVGQRYTVKTLIDALLIPSGNDAAYVLAVNTARVAANDSSLNIDNAISDFIRLMNKKAKDLGCTSTYFCTPDGYDADGQETTANDMVKISLAAQKNPTIASSVSKEKSGTWTNSNSLVCTDSSYYNECVTGLKTGSTSDAGYCVAVSATVDEKQYIMIFLNCTTRDGRFADANTFIDIIQSLNTDVSLAA